MNYQGNEEIVNDVDEGWDSNHLQCILAVIAVLELKNGIIAPSGDVIKLPERPPHTQARR